MINLYSQQYLQAYGLDKLFTSMNDSAEFDVSGELQVLAQAKGPKLGQTLAESFLKMRLDTSKESLQSRKAGQYRSIEFPSQEYIQHSQHQDYILHRKCSSDHTSCTYQANQSQSHSSSSKLRCDAKISQRRASSKSRHSKQQVLENPKMKSPNDTGDQNGYIESLMDQFKKSTLRLDAEKNADSRFDSSNRDNKFRDGATSRRKEAASNSVSNS